MAFPLIFPFGKVSCSVSQLSLALNLKRTSQGTVCASSEPQTQPSRSLLMSTREKHNPCSRDEGVIITFVTYFFFFKSGNEVVLLQGSFRPNFPVIGLFLVFRMF